MPSAKAGKGCDHHAHGIEPGVHELNEVDAFFQDPIGTGEAEIARAQMQHLDDVLRLQDLGFEPLERQVRPIAPPAEGDADAGVPKEGQHAVLHPAFGQGEMDQR